MDEMLSQEEINALLRGLDDDIVEPAKTEDDLTDNQKDAIGEVSNISMGTAATTLFSLVNQKVDISTPRVSVTTWEEIVQSHQKPMVTIQIVYKEGLDGTNLLMLKESDVKVITDLMMGGDGTNIDSELTELHLSAIGEAMNQMIGSAATSMSSMFERKIDIQPPISSQVNLSEQVDPFEVADFLAEKFIKVSFNLTIGDLVDSEMMQLYPMDFAKKIYESFEDYSTKDDVKAVDTKKEAAPQTQSTPQHTSNAQEQQPYQQQPYQQDPYQQQPYPQQPYPQQPYPQQPYPQQPYQQQPYQGMPFNSQMPNRQIDVQPAQFQTFDYSAVMQQKENIDLIMDVPLEVTVELGRTHKSIKDILEFAPGTIIELSKLAGEPIDVLVNGKIVAKGEVVVIEENFSIRVTEIIKTTPTQIRA